MSGGAEGDHRALIELSNSCTQYTKRFKAGVEDTFDSSSPISKSSFARDYRSYSTRHEMGGPTRSRPAALTLHLICENFSVMRSITRSDTAIGSEFDKITGLAIEFGAYCLER